MFRTINFGHIAFVAVAFSSLILLGSASHAETIRGRDGRKIGTISQEGSRTVFRDANGNAKSYSQQEGGQTIYRDMNGNRLGTISR